MTRVLWILLLSIPFLAFSLASVVVLILIVAKEFHLDLLILGFLFGGIAFLLLKLLIGAFGESGGEMEETEFPAKINLAFGGKEPGLSTYLTYLLLGPLAFALFNRGLVFSKSRNPQLNKTQRKRLGLFLMILTWLMLLGAVVSVVTEHGVVYVAIAVLAILLTWPISIGVALFLQLRRSMEKDRNNA